MVSTIERSHCESNKLFTINLLLSRSQLGSTACHRLHASADNGDTHTLVVGRCIQEPGLNGGEMLISAMH